jgi:hypothetical protein
VYLLVFHAYINEIHASRSKFSSKNLVHTHTHTHTHIYIYIYIYVKFLALLGAPYIYDISKLRVNVGNVLLCVIYELTVAVFMYVTRISRYIQRSALSAVSRNCSRSWNVLPVDTGALLHYNIRTAVIKFAIYSSQ